MNALTQNSTKTISIFMLALVFVASACSKKNVEPSLADRAAGLYSINSVKLNNKAGSGITGKIDITTKTTESVDIKVTLTYQGQSESDSFAGLTLKADGTDIDIYQGKDLSGTITGSNIIFYVADGSDLWELKGAK